MNTLSAVRCPALFFVSFSFVARRGQIFRVKITQEKFEKAVPIQGSALRQ